MEIILAFLGAAVVSLIQLRTFLYENGLWPYRLPRLPQREEVAMAEIPKFVPSFHYGRHGLWALVETPDGGAKSMQFLPKIGRWINTAGYMEFSWENHAISPSQVERMIGKDAYESLFTVPKMTPAEWNFLTHALRGYGNA